MIIAAGAVLLGGLLFTKVMRPRQPRPGPMGDRLNDPPPAPAPSTYLATLSPAPKLWAHLDRITVEQHLVLSTSTLGLAALGAFGVPFLSLCSCSGLLYLNLYFLRRAYVDWQTAGLTGVTDAIVATGLLITRQWGADALFTTTYFVSQKFLQQTQTNLARQLSQYSQHTEAIKPSSGEPTAEHALTLVPQTLSPNQVGWQKAIRQGTLPFLTLSVMTMPFFGVKRALAVLVTNFGYDYRVTAPLSTLTHIELAAEQEIVITDWRAFEQLHQVNVLLLDEQLFAVPIAERAGAATASEQVTTWQMLQDLQQDGRRECFILRTAAAPGCVAQTKLAWPETAGLPATVTTVTQHEASALIPQLQAAGRTIGLVSGPTLSVDMAALADVVMVITEQQTKQTSNGQLIVEGAHIVIPTGHLEQMLALLQLADQLGHNLRRGFVITILPSIFSLSGIYFFHVSALIPLLLDGGGLAVGVLNARLPRLRSQSMGPDDCTITVASATCPAALAHDLDR